MKKVIEQSQKQIEELTRKENEWEKSLLNYQQRFVTSCADLKIKGNDIRNELIGLTIELPQFYQQIVDLSQNQKIKEAINYYRSITIFMLSFDNSITNSSVIEELNDDNQFLTYLLYINKYGNDTIQQRQSRLRGDLIINNDTLNNDNNNNNNDNDNNGKGVSLEIDWTVIEDNNNNNNNNKNEDKQQVINWDIDIIEDNNNNNDKTIVWEIDDNSLTGENDTLIELVDSALTNDTVKVMNDISNNNNNNDDNDNNENSNNTILENGSTRIKYVDNVMELYEFLRQKIEEMESKESVVSVNMMQDIPISLQVDTSVLNSWKNAVNDIVNVIQNERLRMLLEIKTSTR